MDARKKTQNHYQSKYKTAIFKKIEAYQEEITHPTVLRELSGTDNKRQESIHHILAKKEDHDLLFLFDTLSEADNNNLRSSFRDKIGKEAYLQLINYIAGGIECILLMKMAYAMMKDQSLLATTGYATTIILVDRLEKHLHSLAAYQGLHESIRKGLDSLCHTSLDQVIIAIKKSLSQLTLHSVIHHAKGILLNAWHFSSSNAFFVHKKWTEQQAAVEIKNQDEKHLKNH